MGLKSTFRRILSSRGFNHPLVPAGLFAVTVLTTLVAGALQAGVNPFEDPWQIWKGIPFSFTLLLILGCHELGHWLASRKHGVDVSFPYFIPGPTLVGTPGAFIAMKSPISDRNALIDIGAAGPLAGLAVTIPVLFAGLALSQVVPAVQTEGVGIHLGECALFSAINWVVNGTLGPDQDVILHPVAFAAGSAFWSPPSISFPWGSSTADTSFMRYSEPGSGRWPGWWWGCCWSSGWWGWRDGSSGAASFSSWA